MPQIAMTRILGIEKKNRENTRAMIEREFIELIKKNNIALSDFVNVQLEKGLIEKGLLK
jgi:hypothetical protein